jgi:solute carrier family 25 S-adenosylmethionine transporter 26
LGGGPPGGGGTWVLPGLYRGLLPALVGVVPTALVYMPTYEFSKVALRDTSFSPLAGCITGCVCACVRVPISVIKSRVQLQLYDRPMAALRGAISGAEGIRGLYSGFRATLVLDVTYAAVQFALLERIRLVADRLVDGRPLTAVEDSGVGFTVGLLTATLTEPLDLVRTRIMTQRRDGQSESLGWLLRGSGTHSSVPLV